ncbi:MAG: hypothetical protein EBX57_00140 [Betaproteobacteria bacterium]|nr:hypothetical protein [Betaproteobacteria bacterium]
MLGIEHMKRLSSHRLFVDPKGKPCAKHSRCCRLILKRLIKQKQGKTKLSLPRRRAVCDIEGFAQRLLILSLGNQPCDACAQSFGRSYLKQALMHTRQQAGFKATAALVQARSPIHPADKTARVGVRRHFDHRTQRLGKRVHLAQKVAAPG